MTTRLLGFALIAGMTGGCFLITTRVLSYRVGEETLQLVGDEVELYESMQRSEPLVPEQRCEYWTARVAESEQSKDVIVGKVQSTENLKRVVSDRRSRACLPSPTANLGADHP